MTTTKKKAAKPKPKTAKAKPKPKTAKAAKPKTTKPKAKPKTAKPKAKPKGKSKTAKKAKAKSDESIGDIGIVIVEDDITIDKEKVNEERRAYLEEARSQEAFD